MDIQKIRKSVKESNINWNKHSLERMMKRGIAREEVRQAVLQGEIIEEYPNDYPLPSCLIFSSRLKPLHVVLAYNEENQTIYIITVYIPDLKHFENDLKTRKKI
jgi:hypothetical protein